MPHEESIYAVGSKFVAIPLTVKVNINESYDPSDTDEGESPLQTYDWGTSIAIMRGGGADATTQYYDYNYDGFGNSKYRVVSGEYAMTSDSIDNWGNTYDYNADIAGIGDGERFSLKITAYKHDEEGNILTDAQGNELISSDPAIRNRGLFDTFMSEYAHFLLNRKKFAVKMLCEAAELVDIPNHWEDRYEVGPLTGWINKVKSHITNKAGLEEVELEMYCL